ncbi:MAG TPA: hypothetical protein VKH19_13320 [Gemmatimonadaceae bacterium]|nr:hypothetical protein [Gemmatimonadaceae bacterium]
MTDRLSKGFAAMVAAMGWACTATPTDLRVDHADSGSRPVTGAGRYVAVTAGFVHTCALASEGQVTCWGGNDYDQLGSETPVSRDCGGRRCSTTPVPLSGDLRFVSIASGWVANCGVTAQGLAHCWGGGAFDMRGYLGDGRLSRSASPVLVQADSQFASVSLGDGQTCALTRSGVAYCWGQNDLGQVGDGTRTHRALPVRVATTQRFRQLSAGAYHTCGVTIDGEAQCWGDNRWGQLGSGNVSYDATDASSTVPVSVAGGMKFVAVASGWEHTCGIASDGAALCWGRNEDAHQLGDESTITHRGAPAPIAGALRFESLTAGPLSTCGRTVDGDSYCWGGNYYGGLGNGEIDPAGVDHPVRILFGPFIDIAIGQGHSCGIGSDAQVRCWGDQTAGQF